LSPPFAETKALGKRAKQGVVWSWLREGVGEMLAFPASLIMARLLSPTEFGIAAAAGFFTLLAGRLSELGFNAAIVRSKDLRPIHLSTVFVASLVLGLVSFAALQALAPAIAAFYGIQETAGILRIAAFSFLVAPFGAVPAALLARNMMFRQGATIAWMNSASWLATSVLLAWLGFSYMSLVYGRLVGVTVTTVARVTFARWRPSLAFSFASLREILPYGAGVHAKRLLDYAAQQGDNLVVGKVLGVEALGFYDKAFSTVERFLARLNTGGPNVMFRIFAVIHEDPGRFRRAYQKVVMSASLLGFTTFAVLIALAPQLIVVLFGERWSPSTVPFQLLSLAAALKVMNTYASSATQAAGRIWSEVWRQLMLIVLIAGGIVGFREWGPVGAAGAVLLATATMTLLMHVLLHRVTHLRWRDIASPLLPGFCSAAIAVAVVLGVEQLVRQSTSHPAPWLLLACQVPAAGLAVLAFVLFAPLQGLRRLVREIAEDLLPKRIQSQSIVKAYLAQPSTTGEASR
jgi:PST family polysaccharide transporter